MSRRKAFLAALALCGGAAASAAPLATAAPATPIQCPPHQLVTQSDGNFYVWLPNPSHEPSCWTTVEIPGNIQKPGGAPAGVIPAPTSFPPPCPVQPLVYESNGHDYVSVPDPTGKSCRIVIELPVTVPPSR